MKRLFKAAFSIIFLLAAPVSWARTSVPFHGRIDFTNKELQLDVTFPNTSAETSDQGQSTSTRLSASYESPSNDPTRQGSLSMKVHQSNEQEYALFLNVNHFQTPFFLITSELHGQLNVLQTNQTQQTFFKGFLKSSNSLINYRPAEDISAYFRFDRDSLEIQSLKLEHLILKGVLKLSPPFQVSGDVRVVDMPMPDFIHLWSRKLNVDSSGDVNGDITVGGKIKRLDLNGDLESFNGHVGKLNFQHFNLKAQGAYPIINVSRSKITQNEGMTYALKGLINLSDTENFKKQISALDISPLVSQGNQESEWTIKQKTESSGTTEFKYLLRSQENDSTLQEDKGILGVERKMEF
ncbi:MAG: hypothetical protein KC713_04175 [Candidatus Omnitrophica bacterium]|nr:hypothetical protein [Candidatus Omnitrophota bacterium]